MIVANLADKKNQARIDLPKDADNIKVFRLNGEETSSEILSFSFVLSAYEVMAIEYSQKD